MYTHNEPVDDLHVVQDALTAASSDAANQTQINFNMLVDASKILEQLAEAQAQVAALQAQLAAEYDDVSNGIQALLDSKSVGATINIPPGEYRLTAPLVPKDGQQILCNGATFKGSGQMPTWERDGSYYVASGELPMQTFADQGVCEIVTGPDANGCRVLEDVFNGGKKLDRVMQLKNLASGKVYSDYLTNKVYIVDAPDNAEIALTRFFMNSTAKSVRVSNAKVLYFASPSQQGALTIQGTDWDVDNCLFAYNHSSGLHVTGADRLHAHDNIMEYNGQAGMTHHKTNNSLIENNIFRGNNTNDYYRRDWESAGLKVTFSNLVDINSNLSEDNLGVGIWCDIDNKDIYIGYNTIRNNFSCGIRYEISFDAEIRSNVIEGNGFGHAGPGRGSDYSGFATAGIHLNGAGGMDNGVILIQNNILGKNQNGIHLEERNRGKSQTYPTYNWTTRNVKVLNNTVDLTRAAQGYGTGVVGMGTLGTPSSDIYNAGNVFEGNKYTAPNITDAQFHCKDGTVNMYRAFARWQALGYDQTGSITVV